jgi:hypothetical protein
LWTPQANRELLTVEPLRLSGASFRALQEHAALVNRHHFLAGAATAGDFA